MIRGRGGCTPAVGCCDAAPTVRVRGRRGSRAQAADERRRKTSDLFTASWRCCDWCVRTFRSRFRRLWRGPGPSRKGKAERKPGAQFRSLEGVPASDAQNLSLFACTLPRAPPRAHSTPPRSFSYDRGRKQSLAGIAPFRFAPLYSPPPRGKPLLHSGTPDDVSALSRPQLDFGTACLLLLHDRQRRDAWHRNASRGAQQAAGGDLRRHRLADPICDCSSLFGRDLLNQLAILKPPRLEAVHTQRAPSPRSRPPENDETSARPDAYQHVPGPSLLPAFHVPS